MDTSLYAAHLSCSLFGVCVSQPSVILYDVSSHEYTNNIQYAFAGLI